MSSEVVAAHESNLVFSPNMWSGTCGEQHMNKSTSDNEDTHNVIYEDEDGQAFPDLDPTWHVSRDLNENELDCSNEDEEYMDPTRNIQIMDLGMLNLIPILIQIQWMMILLNHVLWKQNFMNLPKKVHREPMLGENGRFLGIKITLFKPCPQ